jgi:hypothetical protein
VIGPRPERSPSLTDHPAADRAVHDIAQELWGEGGTEKVVRDQPLPSVLHDMGLAPDVELSVSAVEWTHRRGESWDLYFLANQSQRALSLDATFRVAGRVPEIWYPDTGAVDMLPLWREEGGRTVVPLDFDPCGSLFVVFARPQRPGERRAPPHPEMVDLPPPLPLHGPWSLSFPNVRNPQDDLRIRLEKLVSWPELPQTEARYYSGTVTYETEFELPEGLLAKDRALRLDLGVVHEMAEIRVNGVDLGVAWKPPFTVDVTRAARPGRNVLALRVTNTWRNRLIGDYGKAAADRTTYVVPMLRKGQPWLPGGPGTTLSPAGVLGPVMIRSVPGVPVR